jgi:hypothetical protein
MGDRMRRDPTSSAWFSSFVLALSVVATVAGCGKSALPTDAGTTGGRGGGGGLGGNGSGGSGGNDAGQDSLKWFLTCGFPVCGGPSQPADAGLTACTNEKAGDPCSLRDATCDPHASCGEKLKCTDHDPRMQPGGCPISRARFKQDIAYLGPVELKRYSDQLLDIPLATYRYKDDPSSRQQLGFIIEDVEPSLSVDAQRDRVDLYGYASMAVAALKVQAQELQALRRELHAQHKRIQELEAATKSQ